MLMKKSEFDVMIKRFHRSVGQLRRRKREKVLGAKESRKQ
jgi:hypothetical protein